MERGGGGGRRAKNNTSGDNCPLPTGESPPVGILKEGGKGKILTTFESDPPTPPAPVSGRFVHAVRLYSVQFLSAR